MPARPRTRPKGVAASQARRRPPAKKVVPSSRRPAERDPLGRGMKLDETADRLSVALDRPEAMFGAVDEDLINRFIVPYKLIRSYCRVTVEGLHHIPKGRAVLAANHTGWLGLDYANLAISIHDQLGRIVRGVVHPLWFANPRIGNIAQRLGLVPAQKDLIVKLLGEECLVVIFPEAEHGAFKPTDNERLYELREFKRGFIRTAMQTQAPIVPVAIVGGEEANPVLAQLKLTDWLFRLPLPIPRNIVPRPVKWRISILPAIPMDGYTAKDAENRDLVHELADKVQKKIQEELRIQLHKRGNKYL